MKNKILSTGSAGFLGSHLTEKLLKEGNDVLVVGNFFTGTKQNLALLLGNSNLEVMRHDVNFPLYVKANRIYNLACPASPVHYQYDSVQITKTSVHGAINILALPKEHEIGSYKPLRVKYIVILKSIPNLRSAGARSIRLGFALAITKVSAVLKHSFLTIAVSTTSILN